MALFNLGSLIGTFIKIDAKYKSENNTNSGNTTNSNNTDSTIENSTENIGDKVEQTVENFHDTAPSDKPLSFTSMNDKELDENTNLDVSVIPATEPAQPATGVHTEAVSEGTLLPETVFAHRPSMRHGGGTTYLEDYSTQDGTVATTAPLL